jgi:hypothetical protein
MLTPPRSTGKTPLQMLIKHAEKAPSLTMKQPPTPGEKLGILFRNKIRRRGDINNVHLDPVMAPSLELIVERNLYC